MNRDKGGKLKLRNFRELMLKNPSLAAAGGSYEDFMTAYENEPKPNDFCEREGGNALLRLLRACGLEVGNKNGERNLLEKIKIARFLLEHGADVHYTEKEKPGAGALRALYESARETGPYVSFEFFGEFVFEMTKLLVEHGADVNQKNRYGSPVYDAIMGMRINKKDKARLMDYLLRHGMDLNLKNDWINEDFFENHGSLVFEYYPAITEVLRAFAKETGKSWKIPEMTSDEGNEKRE